MCVVCVATLCGAITMFVSCRCLYERGRDNKKEKWRYYIHITYTYTHCIITVNDQSNSPYSMKLISPGWANTYSATTGDSSNTRTHARTHAHTHTRTHTCTHTRTHARTRTHAHTHTHTDLGDSIEEGGAGVRGQIHLEAPPNNLH